ncbi:DUF1016 N-terminal domain-containing protein [Flammeovirga pacifica]|uniref:Uncharacterized protein n=1 Tax=Flammeovirga pacifica TaxID=915059 RepID=A0A1S1Z0F0_FLAPC|nr:DUF1016 N-terminal domain-containing protein [Flammeovirga pacifica]OHX66717.1 hypothetical protein NH26_10290 [Flammeovirga pacifica]
MLEKVSKQLQQELLGLRGFSGSNLKKMRLFFKTWAMSNEISSTMSNQLDLDFEISSSLTTELRDIDLRAFFKEGEISDLHCKIRGYEILDQEKLHQVLPKEG